MTKFSNFLETIIHRNSIPMDQDDINYLKQFPRRFWIDAIQKRYSELLLNAIESLEKYGRIPEDANLTLNSLNGKANFDIKTGMSKLIEKLKNLNFEINDPQRTSNTLSGMVLMNKMQAGKLIRDWEKYSKENNPSGELLPGFAKFTPNKLQKSINTLDNSFETNNQWIKIKDKVEQMAKRAIQSRLNSASDPNNILHLNYYYWRERQDELLKDVLDKVKNNLGNERIINDPKYLGYVIAHEVLGKFQNSGHVGRRMLQKAKNQGINIGDLIQKGYSIQQISNSINKMKSYRSIRGEFEIGQPEQHPDLKNIHQSIPVQEKNPSRNYIQTKRNSATQNALKNKIPATSIYPFRDWLIWREYH